MLHVLQVEDNIVDVELFQRALNKSGIKVRHDFVQDGEQALNFLLRKDRYSDVKRPDLILLDLNMPGKNGREVLAEIKNDRQLKLIPVIVLTNSSSDVDVSYCYEKGASCYLVKPADVSEFTHQMKKLFDFWQEVKTPAAEHLA